MGLYHCRNPLLVKLSWSPFGTPECAMNAMVLRKVDGLEAFEYQSFGFVCFLELEAFIEAEGSKI